MKKEKTSVDRIERRSVDFIAEQVAKLKEVFPEAVSEGKVDFENRTTLGDEDDLKYICRT